MRSAHLYNKYTVRSWAHHGVEMVARAASVGAVTLPRQHSSCRVEGLKFDVEVEVWTGSGLDLDWIWTVGVGGEVIIDIAGSSLNIKRSSIPGSAELFH